MRISLRILLTVAAASLVLVTAGNALSPAEEGRRLFVANNCYGCHGGRAGGGMCPNLRALRPNVDTVRMVVLNGTPIGMPAFPNMSEQDIQNIAAYIRTLGSLGEPTFTHWWEAVPSQ